MACSKGGSVGSAAGGESAVLSVEVGAPGTRRRLAHHIERRYDVLFEQQRERRLDLALGGTRRQMQQPHIVPIGTFRCLTSKTSESRVLKNGTPGLMSGDWKRSTISGLQRLQWCAWTAPDLSATAPAPTLPLSIRTRDTWRTVAYSGGREAVWDLLSFANDERTCI
jgi:hypothetical protein